MQCDTTEIKTSFLQNTGVWFMNGKKSYTTCASDYYSRFIARIRVKHVGILVHLVL